MSYQDLKSQYLEDPKSIEVWTNVYERMLKLCKLISKDYQKEIYNDDIDWNEESFQQLAQEVITIRMIDQDQLRISLALAQDESHFTYLMRRQIKQHLSKRRRRDVVDNIFDRLKEIAKNDDFLIETIGKELWFCLNDKAAEKRTLSASEIRELANLVWDIPRIPQNPNSSRNTMVYTTVDLTEVLRRILSQIGCIERRDLSLIFERFLTPFARADLEDVADQSVEDLSFSMIRKEEMTVIHEFVNSLDERERSVLYLKHQNVSDSVIADRLGASRPTIAGWKQDVFSKVENELLRYFDAELYAEAIRLAVIEISNLAVQDEE